MIDLPELLVIYRHFRHGSCSVSVWALADLPQVQHTPTVQRHSSYIQALSIGSLPNIPRQKKLPYTVHYLTITLASEP